MDLFWSDSNKTNVIKALRKEIIRNNNLDNSFNILYMNCKLKELEDNSIILFVLPKINKTFYNKNEDKYIKKCCKFCNIDKYAVIYSYPFEVDTLTKKNVKSYSYTNSIIIDTLVPKLIIVCGEDSTLTFMNTKIEINTNTNRYFKWKEYYDSYITYDINYINDLSTIEGNDYKQNILYNDWHNIKNMINKGN